MKIEYNIRELLRVKKITYDEFAKMMGKTKPTIVNWLNGRSKLDGYTLLEIAKKLEVPVSSLLGEEPAISRSSDAQEIVELKNRVEKLRFLVKSIRIALISIDPKYAREIDEMLEEVNDW